MVGRGGHEKVAAAGPRAGRGVPRYRKSKVNLGCVFIVHRDDTRRGVYVGICMTCAFNHGIAQRGVLRSFASIRNHISNGSVGSVLRSWTRRKLYTRTYCHGIRDCINRSRIVVAVTIRFAAKLALSWKRARSNQVCCRSKSTGGGSSRIFFVSRRLERAGGVLEERNTFASPLQPVRQQIAAHTVDTIVDVESDRGLKRVCGATKLTVGDDVGVGRPAKKRVWGTVIYTAIVTCVRLPGVKVDE